MISLFYNDISMFLQHIIPFSVVLNMRQRSTDSHDAKGTAVRIFGTVAAGIIIAVLGGALGSFVSIKLNSQDIQSVKESTADIKQMVIETRKRLEVMDNRVFNHVRRPRHGG